MDTTDIKRLEVKNGVKPRAAFERYTALRARGIAVFTAFMLCAMALAVFLCRGAELELKRQSGILLLERYQGQGITGLILSEGALPLTLGVLAVLSGFSLTPTVPGALSLAVYGFWRGIVICVLYCKSVAVCAVYAASSLAVAMGIMLVFSQGSVFFARNLTMGRRISEILEPRCVFGYMKELLIPISFLLFTVAAQGTLLHFAVKFLS